MENKVSDSGKIASNKREDYISWNDYFMAIAVLSSNRSKDPDTQVGACIVNEDNKIIGIGYNGMPNGCSDDMLPWTKNTPDPLKNKHLYVCHAEMNAILLYSENSSMRGCTLYVCLFPCNECAKIIIQSGIKRVIYLSDKHATKAGTVAAKYMLDCAKVEYRQHQSDRKSLHIDLVNITSKIN